MSNNTNQQPQPANDAPKLDDLLTELGELGKSLNEFINGKEKRVGEIINGINANNPKQIEAAVNAIKRLLPKKNKKEKKNKDEEGNPGDDAFSDFYYLKVKKGVERYRNRVNEGKGAFYSMVVPGPDGNAKTQFGYEKMQGNPFTLIDSIREKFENDLRGTSQVQQGQVITRYMQLFRTEYATLEHMVGDAQRQTLYYMLYQGMIISLAKIWWNNVYQSWSMFHKEVVKETIDQDMSYDTMRERVKLYQIVQEYPALLEAGVSPSELARYAARLKKFLEDRPGEKAFMKGNVDAEGNVEVNWNAVALKWSSAPQGYRADIAQFDFEAQPKTKKQQRAELNAIRLTAPPTASNSGPVVVLNPEGAKKEDKPVEAKGDNGSVDKLVVKLEKTVIDSGGKESSADEAEPEAPAQDEPRNHNDVKRLLTDADVAIVSEQLIKHQAKYAEIINKLDTSTRANFWRGLSPDRIALLLELVELDASVKQAFETRSARVKKGQVKQDE